MLLAQTFLILKMKKTGPALHLPSTGTKRKRNIKRIRNLLKKRNLLHQTQNLTTHIQSHITMMKIVQRNFYPHLAVF